MPLSPIACSRPRLPSRSSTTRRAWSAMADKHAILDGFASRFSEVASSSGGRLALREVPFSAQLDFRANPADGRVVDSVHKALGFVLPTDPNTAASAGGRTALGEIFGSVVDVSANRTVIELSGPAARDVLAHGCLVDLHPRDFGTGSCAQTLLAKAQVTVHQVNDAPTFQLYLRTSFAWYAAEWLLDAMTEYCSAESAGISAPL